VLKIILKFFKKMENSILLCIIFLTLKVLIIDKKLKKVIEDKILRMEIYLSTF